MLLASASAATISQMSPNPSFLAAALIFGVDSEDKVTQWHGIKH